MSVSHETSFIILRCGLCAHDMPVPFYADPDGTVHLRVEPTDTRHICHGAISYEQAARFTQPFKKKATKKRGKS